MLSLAAYLYLAYILLSFEHYGEMAEHFRNVGLIDWLALGGCVVLFPLNILMESWKWRYLLRDLQPLSLAEAQQQVYFGFVGAFLTPNRLGDYPARASLLADKNHLLPAITLGFVGSMALMAVNILCGLLAVLLTGANLPGVNTKLFHASALAILLFFALVVCLLPMISKRLNRRPWGQRTHALLQSLSTFSPKRFLVVLLQSLCRYIVYATQLLLVLVFCGADLPLSLYLTVIPIYYLVLTVAPTVPAADAAVRGGVGALVFSFFTTNTAPVALATILLWGINTVFPMIIGSYVGKKS